MWTYLFLLLGGLALLAVFIRRVVIAIRGEKVMPNEKKREEPSSDDISQDSAEPVPRKERAEAEGLFKKGQSLSKAGKEDEAIKHFVQVLAIDTAHRDTQNELARLYMNKQMYGAAASLFKQLAKAEEDPVHFSHLGFALFQQSDLDAAKTAYQKAVDLDPSRPQRFISLSQVHRAAKELAPAIIAVNKAIEIEDDNVDFLFLLADLHAEAGNVEEAKVALNKVLEIDPDNADAKALIKKLDTPPDEAEA